MSDDDLIRRGDARRIALAYATSEGAERADNAIAALPAVTVGVTTEDIDALAYRFWSIHPKDIPEPVGMPKGYKGGPRAWFFATEIRRILAALEPVTQPAPDVQCPCGSDVTDMDGHIVHEEGCEGENGDPQPAPDADDSYPYDAIEQCERDLDGAEDEPVVNEKLRTMHQEYLRAIAEGRLVTDAVSPTDARLRAAVAQLDAGAIREAALREAHDAIAEYPRVSPDSTEAQHYDEQIEHCQSIILALTEKPHDRA